MAKYDAGVISAGTLSTGQHYYSSGDHLRAKHHLAGDGYVRWALDLIPNWTAASILDAGGGWGRYVLELIDHYGVRGRNAVLTDLSAGMLITAREEAAGRDLALRTSVNNLEALPFANQQFDIVMVNKVLYHLQDIPRGIRELARVTRPEGVLMATTNSEKVKVLIIDLHYQAMDKLGIAYTPESPSPFSMENGGDLLAARFRQVDVYYYAEETLIANAAEMRARYETIGRYRNLLPRDDISEAAKRALPEVVEQLAQAIINRDGVLRAPGLMGAFICTEPVG